MASNANRLSGPRGRGANPRRFLSLGVAALVLLALGWFAAGWWASTNTFVLKSEFAGTVSVVNASGSNICITPTDGGADRCGVAYQGRDDPILKVGDSVRVVVATIKQTPDTSIEVFVVASINP